MEYGAITIDTQIFCRNNLKLESGILKVLEQFNGKPYPLVLSEIVVRELQSKLRVKAKESRALVKRACRESIVYLDANNINSDTAEAALIPEMNDVQISKHIVSKFILATGAKVILTRGNVELDSILKLYFNNEPPFAETGKKKNEFPDAIALMSLQSWAIDNNTKILAVSGDGDWKKFSETRFHIDVIDDLAEAISKFQPDSSALDFCKKIANKLPTKQPPDLYRSIQKFLNEELSEVVTYARCSTTFFSSSDQVDMVVDDFKFKTGLDGNDILQPIQGQDFTLIAEAKLSIAVKASTTFSLSVRDSMDKYYVPIGISSSTKDIEFEAAALLTFEGDFDGDIDDIKLISLELLSYPDEVDFGVIEPDWLHEDQ